MRSSRPEVVPDPLMVRQWMFDRMAIMALHGEREIDARSLFGFQKAGTLRELGRPDVPYARLVKVASNPRHRLRVASTPGPCIVIKPERDSEEHRTFQVSGLLLEEVAAHREAAVHYLEGLAAAGLMTDRSKQTISASRSALLSSDPTAWRPAAVKVYDAAEQDWLLCLAGLRQALEWNLETSVRDYLPRVLRPSVAAVDSIDLRWWHPARQRDEIIEAVCRLAKEADSITQALDGYLGSFGFLPLAPEMAMGRLVREWRSFHPEAVCGWDELRSWADGVRSPLARYHVCQALVTAPDLVPPEHAPDFWHEVVALLAAEFAEEPEPQHRAWHLRFLLGRHFCQYFEYVLPWNDGERAPAIAWWLTERVAALFDETGVNLELLADFFFTRTHLHWHLGRPRAGFSELRFQTIFSPTIWQRSLLGQLGGLPGEGGGGTREQEGGSEAAEIRPDSITIDADARALVESDLAIHAWQDLRYERPVPDDGAASDATQDGTGIAYAFELPLVPVLRQWARTSSDAKRRELVETLLGSLQAFSADPPIEQLLRADDPQSLANQANLSGLRAAAYRGDVASDDLQKLIRDGEAMRRLLIATDDNTLWLLIDTLMEVAAAAAEGTELRVSVPHALAAASLECEDDERRRLLFGLMVHTSVATDTVSAIHMILQHPDRGRFLEAASAGHRQLSVEAATAPQWLASRIRAVLSALSRWG